MGRGTDDDFLRAFVGAEVVTKKERKKERKKKGIWDTAKQRKEKKRKKKKREKRWQEQKSFPTPSLDLCADLHSQRPDPSVFLFDDSHIDAVALGQRCPI